MNVKYTIFVDIYAEIPKIYKKTIHQMHLVLDVSKSEIKK